MKYLCFECGAIREPKCGWIAEEDIAVADVRESRINI